MINFKSNINMKNVPKIGDTVDEFLAWIGNPDHSTSGQFHFEITEGETGDYSRLTITTFGDNIVSDISFSDNNSFDSKYIRDFAMKFLPDDIIQIATKEQHTHVDEYEVPHATLYQSKQLEGNEGYITLYIMQEERYSSLSVSLGKDEELFD